MLAAVFAIRLAVVFAAFAWRTAAGGVLAHPWSGCPRIYYWDLAAGCQGAYDYMTDSSWASDVAPRVVTYLDDKFYCCGSVVYRPSDRGCVTWYWYGASSATCVYADNYCPTLTVDAADPAPAACIGDYTQNNNNLWTGDVDPSCTVVWVEEDEVFALHSQGVFVSDVAAHTCHNPTTPLVPEWNKLLPDDEDVFYVSRASEAKPYTGIMHTLPLADSPQKIWISGEPSQDAVVIVQLHNKDPSAAYVAVSDTAENTFRVRVVAPSGCPSHTAEDLTYLMTDKGVYTADVDQMAEAGWGTVTVSDMGTFIPFTSPFASTPVVLTTIRENTGALQDYIHSRIVSVTPTGFTVVLETETPHSDINPAWSAEVNFFAIHTNSLITGLFGPRKYFAYVSSPPETITADFQTFTYPTDYPPEYLDTALFLDLPHVFVASQAASDWMPVESRLGSYTVTDLSFALREDTCVWPVDNVHTEDVYGILALSWGTDKYATPTTPPPTTPPPSTTTTTTTATTTTTMTTTTTTTTPTELSTATAPATATALPSSTSPPPDDDRTVVVVVSAVAVTAFAVAALAAGSTLYARRPRLNEVTFEGAVSDIDALFEAPQQEDDRVVETVVRFGVEDVGSQSW